MSYQLSDEAKLEWLKNQLRKQRNIKLLNSDWTQLANGPLNSTKKAAWKNYRKALRDLPATITELNDDGEIDVTWPQEPEA